MCHGSLDYLKKFAKETRKDIVMLSMLHAKRFVSEFRMSNYTSLSLFDRLSRKNSLFARHNDWKHDVGLLKQYGHTGGSCCGNDQLRMHRFLSAQFICIFCALWAFLWFIQQRTSGRPII